MSSAYSKTFEALVRLKHEETLLQQQRHNFIQKQYDLIRPFCPVCGKRHEPGTARATVSPHGIARCHACAHAKKLYPIPSTLLEMT